MLVFCDSHKKEGNESEKAAFLITISVSHLHHSSAQSPIAESRVFRIMLIFSYYAIPAMLLFSFIMPL